MHLKISSAKMAAILSRGRWVNTTASKYADYIVLTSVLVYMWLSLGIFRSHIYLSLRVASLALGQSPQCLSLQWCHNDAMEASIHRRLDCCLNRLFGRRLKKTSKLRVTGLCEGNLPVTGEFTAQRASNAENVSIWWRHHRTTCKIPGIFCVFHLHLLFTTWNGNDVRWSFR